MKYQYHISYYFLFYYSCYAFLPFILLLHHQKIIGQNTNYNSVSIPSYYLDYKNINTPYTKNKQVGDNYSNYHRLKILFVLGRFPLLAEKAILNQIIGLIKRNQDVYIYASKNSGDLSKNHADVEQYKLLNRTFYKKLPSNLNTFDIIFCQFGPHGIKLANIKKQNGFRGKLITCFRGADLSKTVARNSHAYDELFKVGDFFMPVCNFFKNRLINLGCDPSKIIVHHSAIDCSKFKFKKRYPESDSSIRIASTCRLVEKKGLEYAIRAVAQIYQKHPNIQYLIIGGGPLEEELKQLIKQLKAEKYIKLIGWCTSEEVANILNYAHLFILPSITAIDGDQEGIANALKEAMAMGLPVISTYHAGTAELIQNGISGFLVPERNINAIVNRLEYLINHPEIWPVMGLTGRQKVEREFNIEKENDKLVHIFQELLLK